MILRQQQSQVKRINSAGEEILEFQTSSSKHLFRDKLEGINSRWEVLCAEVFARQKRYVHGPSHTAKMVDLGIY